MQDKCKLSINDLRLWIHLGCGPEEKVNPQQVSVDIDFFFDKAPLGIETDNLEDTLCYLKIVEAIQALVKQKTFNLIEHVVGCIHKVIHAELSSRKSAGVNYEVAVRKVAPPAPGVYGGVTFSYMS